MFEKSTALIIEDSPIVSTYLHSVLVKDLRFGSVIITKNGEEGMIAFKRTHIDWIFSEIETPLMSGLEVLAAVRDSPNGRDVPFILFTAQVSKHYVSEAFVMDATEFVAKPLNGQVIVEKVRHIATAKPSICKSASSRRRRVHLNREARISFSSTLGYTGEIINMSLSGCLIRAPIFTEGGMVSDEVRLSLKDAKGEIMVLKALLVRLELDKAHTNDAARSLIAAFQFDHLSDALHHALKQLLIESAMPSLGVH